MQRRGEAAKEQYQALYEKILKLERGYPPVSSGLQMVIEAESGGNLVGTFSQSVYVAQDISEVDISQSAPQRSPEVESPQLLRAISPSESPSENIRTTPDPPPQIMSQPNGSINVCHGQGSVWQTLLSSPGYSCSLESAGGIRGCGDLAENLLEERPTINISDKSPSNGSHTAALSSVDVNKGTAASPYLSPSAEETISSIPAFRDWKTRVKAVLRPDWKVMYNRQKSIHCEDCDRWFEGKYRNSSLNRHRKIAHGNATGGAKVFPCQEEGCEKVYGRNDARLKHYRSKHPQRARPYIPRKAAANEEALSDEGLSSEVDEDIEDYENEDGDVGTMGNKLLQ
ncbi:hypothetical protein BCR34DRAFT_608561 [Clohesyomyces aquaticus]|uniref:C2H2-type domain-containing protein n=1 Tax=Clohesyomyces aquaticus TaxID=1231657 RepID=A0A1Y1Y6E5_9PLEO|nr:hypothetical protein BCR34DRAFT_608561 [Clohesyomyces aquaticus]